jgi:hypothetical protein
VYSSRNLTDWRDEGIALAVTDDPTSDIVKGALIERPKVIYNPRIASSSCGSIWS